jgi:pyrimidine-specific ribonucleoside hydrolase
MKNKRLRFVGIVAGVLVFLFAFIVLATPLWVQLGVKPVCIQGEWPHLKFVSCEETTVASATVTPLPQPNLNGNNPIPVIVDDDGSPDGVTALLYFLSNPNYNVQAVTVSYGEAHPDVFAGHMLQLLAGLGRADIPVGAGRSTPLEGNNAFPDSWRQASDTFWGIDLPPASVNSDPVPAAELIVNTINGSPDPVLMFVSGAHTNLAEALRQNPEIARNIREVYIMGGSVYIPGNIKHDWPAIDNSVSEWNIWVDPVAAAEVFSSGLPLHLVPLDATGQVSWIQSDVPGWDSTGSPDGKLAGELLQWMLDTWSAKGVYIWDLVTAIQVSNPSVCPEVPLAISIVTNAGPELGRTQVTQGAPNVSVCLNPDVGQVKALAASILSRK